MCTEAIVSLVALGGILGGSLAALLLMAAHNHPDRILPPLKEQGFLIGRPDR